MNFWSQSILGTGGYTNNLTQIHLDIDIKSHLTKELFEIWLDNYNQKLKPDLKMGTFRFAIDNDFLNWKNVELNYLRKNLLTKLN